MMMTYTFESWLEVRSGLKEDGKITKLFLALPLLELMAEQGLEIEDILNYNAYLLEIVNQFDNSVKKHSQIRFNRADIANTTRARAEIIHKCVNMAIQMGGYYLIAHLYQCLPLLYQIQIMEFTLEDIVRAASIVRRKANMIIAKDYYLPKDKRKEKRKGIKLTLKSNPQYGKKPQTGPIKPGESLLHSFGKQNPFPISVPEGHQTGPIQQSSAHYESSPTRAIKPEPEESLFHSFGRQNTYPISVPEERTM